MSHTELLSIPNGAKFYRCDLHIHTNTSHDYENKDTTIEQIIEKCVEKGLELIAITDHNDIGDIDEIRKIAEEKNITVLPGVEVSVRGGRAGIHVLALFKEDCSKDHVTDFLGAIEIFSEARGKQEALSPLTVEQVFEKIAEFDGIGIGAHVDSDKGITEDMRGVQRTQLIQSKKIDALEITEPETKNFFDGKDSTYRTKIPCVQFSDAHSLEEIGRRVTRLKMETPSLEGLRQALIDEESRIKFEDEGVNNIPNIIGISIEGGFLDGQSFHFNPNLNCFIGGRGVGKSTLIELIRYALHAPPTIERFQDRHSEMVKNLLGGGTITIYFDVGSGIIYKVTRKYNEQPRIFKDDIEVPDIILSELFPIVVYSETEIEEAARIIPSQLDLLDKFVPDVEEFKRKEASKRNELVINEREISDIVRQINENEEQVSELPTIREKIRMFEEHKFEEKLEAHDLCLVEDILINKIINQYDYIQEIIDVEPIKEKLEQELESITHEKYSKLPNLKLINKAKNYLKRVKGKVIRDINKISKYVFDEKGKITEIKNLIKEDHDLIQEEITEILEKFESNEQDAAVNYMNLKRRENELIIINENLEKLNTKLKELEKTRDKKLEELDSSRTELFKNRKITIESLSDELGDLINISLEKCGQKDKYYNLIDTLLTGTYTNKYEKQSTVESLSPSEFVEIIKNKDMKALTEKTIIQEERAERILGHDKLRERLLSIESVEMPDKPIIQMKVGNVYKSVTDLSLGQRCTTILSLLLLQSEIPLIVDTPEQGLDNMFIFDSVVQSLRNIKENRQVLLATHNANIPVSGDAELITCLTFDAGKGKVQCFGSIDDKVMKETVQKVLEGGEEAFKLRLKKYGH